MKRLNKYKSDLLIYTAMANDLYCDVKTVGIIERNLGYNISVGRILSLKLKQLYFEMRIDFIYFKIWLCKLYLSIRG